MFKRISVLLALSLFCGSLVAEPTQSKSSGAITARATAKLIKRCPYAIAIPVAFGVNKVLYGEAEFSFWTWLLTACVLSHASESLLEELPTTSTK